MHRLLFPSLALATAARGPSGVPRAPRESYSEDRARVLAHYAGAAYCPSDLIEAWACDHCKAAASEFQATVVYNDVSDMQAIVGLNGDGQVIVSFRGSQSLQNWIANLWFSQEEEYPHCDGCQVHSGFYETWQSVEQEVLIAVLQLLKGKSPQPPVFVTGHSLGGVVAVLAAAALHQEHDVAVEGVYTFGEPRAGNEAFRDFFNSGPHISWRVTHYKDPVPHLPFEIMGFTHVNTEVYYNEDNSQYKVCDDSGKDSTCSDQWSNEVDLLANHVDNHHWYVGINIDACKADGDDVETTSAPTSAPATSTTAASTATPSEVTTTSTSAGTTVPGSSTSALPSTSPAAPTTSVPGTTSLAPTTVPTTPDPRCRACDTICDPCRDCVAGVGASFPWGSCDKCWQCWDYDDDKKRDDKDDCNAMDDDHKWDKGKVRCLSDVREDCRLCWGVPAIAV